MENGTPGIDIERIFLAAARAAGPVNGDIGAWQGRCVEISDAMYAGLKAFRHRLIAVKNSITLLGTVQEAIENPTAEQGGKPLDLYKVVFNSDAGTRPDQMWIDKRDPSGAALFAKAKSLVGKRAQIVKEQRTQFVGDDPRLDKDGKEVTNPYLASIRAIGEGAVQASPPTTSPAAPADEAPADEVPVAEKALLTQDEIRSLINLKPKMASEVVQLAADHFGLDPKQVKKEVESVLGPPRRDPENKVIPRTPTECRKAWSTIVQRRVQTS